MNIRELYEAVVSMDADSREKYLLEQCDDPVIRQEILDLVAATDQSLDLASIVGEAAHRMTHHTPETLKKIGIYKIDKRIGQGGMGTVFLAHRDDQHFQQTVAIKVVRLMAATDDLLARFRSERQILADLNHPNIAALLDGGETNEGLPYLVMEYVDGVPIDLYCNEKGFSLTQRLTLFMDLCRAVEYAHQNLIIHRDIKPSNVLVDNTGHLKLLDFGIAKLMRDDLHGGQALTMADTRLLTPENASPEQVMGKPLTTATDVYSLGVLLYQLLSGHPPYRLQALRASEIEKTICQTEPKRPSLVVSKGYTGVENTASLRRRLRGDVDNIVLKCLQKDTKERYASAGQLLEDIERHLNQLPVAAHAPSTWYSVKKFVARKKTPVLTAGLALVVLSVVIAAYTQRLRVTTESAERAALKAERVSDFLGNMFASADPDQTQGRDTTVGDVLDSGTDALWQEPELDDGVKAELFSVIGSTYLGLGDYENSEKTLRESLRLLRQSGNIDPLIIARAEGRLASILRVQHDYGRAEPLFKSSIQTLQTHLDQPSPEIARALNNYAQMMSVSGRYEESLTLMQEAVSQSVATNGINHPETADFYNNLAVTLGSLGRVNEELLYYKKGLDVNRNLLGDRHPDTLQSISNYGLALSRLGRYEEAKGYYEESLEGRLKVLGSHPLTSTSYELLGSLYRRLGEFETAESYLVTSLEMIQEHVGPSHANTARRLRNYGHLLLDTNRPKEAHDVYSQSLAIYQALPSPSWFNLCRMQVYTGAALIDLERFEEAEKQLNNGLGCFNERFGEEFVNRHRGLSEFGKLKFLTGQSDLARQYFNQAITLIKSNYGDNHDSLVRPLVGLGRIAAHRSDIVESQGHFREALNIIQQVFGPDHYQAQQVAAEMQRVEKSQY